MTDIRDLSFDEIKALLDSMGQKPYRASQIYEWLHKRLITSFDEMTNISKELRSKLSKELDLGLPNILEVQEADDGTKKLLMRLDDGECIESVALNYEYGTSICVSTQVGCRMGCEFCASGMDGLIRNLTPSEIIGQVYAINRLIEKRANHLVFMGMGEPFDNYDNVIKAIRILIDEKGQNLSARNITVSTCGVVPGIERLAKEDLPITLALSLHSAYEDKRKKLMPITNKYGLEEVISACKEYAHLTGRRVTYEYCLIPNQNDGDDDASMLYNLLGDSGVHINLIGVHAVVEKNQENADKKAVLSFKKKLEKKGINVTIRRDLGAGIDGACGQLRSRKG